MVIVIDVMGGDNSPEETVKGAYQASLEYDARFVLVGDKDQIENVAKRNSIKLDRFEIVHTPTVIEMSDSPMAVVRAKSDSSMNIGLTMLSEGKADAFVTTGNTGALFTGATLIVRKIKGVQRAAIATVLPLSKPTLVLDAGANIQVDVESLEQFAIMGSAYMKQYYGIASPTVGLLNNGVEDTKGTELRIEANKRLSALDGINYVGNVEGNSVVLGACDVVVTDGFTGNIMLKSIEGMGKMLSGSLNELFRSSPVSVLAYLLVKGKFKKFKKKFDSREHGGAPLLGISKPVIKAHGSSDAVAFKNAIGQAIFFAEHNINEGISENMSVYTAKRKAERAAKKAEQVTV
ncbi:MAG: phosphate acyltransferase PlsX [Clostridia bacterium]|nr:phosphate acyltransferase PlsX [Clostridia bacterium]